MRLVTKKKVLQVFRPEREEITGDWRKLHNEVLDVLYLFPITVICIILVRFGFDISLRLCVLYCHTTVNIFHIYDKFPLIY